MAKGRISKRLFQGNKARQIFRKTNISYPLIRTRTCAYQGVRNVRFSENLMCFIFLKTRFEIRRFVILPTISQFFRVALSRDHYPAKILPVQSQQ